MTPPIFIVCADNEVLVYEEPQRALRYVESPDVESGEYTAVFDAKGGRFEFVVAEPTRRTWFGTAIELTPVTFRALADTPTGADQLRAILLTQLAGAAPDAPLNELVSLAARKLRSP